MNDLYIFCLIFLSLILFHSPVSSLIPVNANLGLATPFLIQSLVLVFLWYQTIKRFLFQWKFQRSQPITKAFAVFLVISIIPVLHSVYPFASMHLWAILLTGFIIYLTISNYQLAVLHEPEVELEFPQRKYRNSLLWVIFLLGLLESLYGIYQYYWGFDIELKSLFANTSSLDARFFSGLEYAFKSKRILGTLGNPNVYATLLAMIFPVGLGLVLQKKEWLYKFIISIGLGLLVFSVYLSASRGGFIALIAGLLVFLIFIGKDKLSENKGWLGIIFIIAIVSILSSEYLFHNQASESTIERIHTGSVTTQERFHYWTIALHEIKAHFLLGGGLDTYGILYGQYKTLGMGETRYTHNLFLQVWSEGGIISLIALLSFLFILFKYPLKRFKGIQRPEVKIQAVAFYSGVIAFLVDSFVGYSFYIPEIYYLFCVLLAGVYAALNAEIVPEPSPSDILWRRQPNTQFLLIAPSVTLVIILFWYFWIYSSFQSELKFQQGRAYLSISQPENAITAYEQSIRYISCNSESHQHLGNTLVRLGQIDKGIQELKRATELNPYTAYYHADLANAYRAFGKFDLAVSEYKKAISCYPQKAIYHDYLAQVYQQLGNVQGAQEEMDIVNRIKSYQP